jgi:hypothetical protein
LAVNLKFAQKFIKFLDTRATFQDFRRLSDIEF